MRPNLISVPFWTTYFQDLVQSDWIISEQLGPGSILDRACGRNSRVTVEDCVLCLGWKAAPLLLNVWSNPILEIKLDYFWTTSPEETVFPSFRFNSSNLLTHRAVVTVSVYVTATELTKTLSFSNVTSTFSLLELKQPCRQKDMVTLC